MDINEVVLRCPKCHQTTISLNTELLYSVNLYQSVEGGTFRTDEKQVGAQHREDMRLFLMCTSCDWATDNIVGTDSDIIVENSELTANELCDLYWYPAASKAVKDFEHRSNVSGVKKPVSASRMTAEQKAWRKECRNFFKQKPSKEEIDAYVSTYVVSTDKLKDFKEIMLRYLASR